MVIRAFAQSADQGLRIDPWTLGAVTAIVLLVALLACMSPLILQSKPLRIHFGRRRATVSEIHRYAMVPTTSQRSRFLARRHLRFQLLPEIRVSNALSFVSTRQLSADDLGEIRFGRLNRTHTA